MQFKVEILQKAVYTPCCAMLGEAHSLSHGWEVHGADQFGV